MSLAATSEDILNTELTNNNNNNNNNNMTRPSHELYLVPRSRGLTPLQND